MYAKIFQKGAFCLEDGRAGATQAPGWGSVNASTVLGAGHAVPYLSMGKSKTVNSVKDNSIVSEGFEDIPRKTGSLVEQPIQFINKFDNINPILYWGFGLEDEALSVVCYVCSAPSVEPVAGAVYSDGSNSLTFLRKEVNKNSTFYIFEQAGVIVSQTGNLTKSSGTGDATIAFTAHSPLMYERFFQIDPRERHLTAVREDEELSGYASGDLKCRMALIGANLGASTDMVNYNAMCKKIAISSAAGEYCKLDLDYLARSQSIGDLSSSTWTYPTGMTASDKNILHHNWFVQLSQSTAISSFVTLGVTSFNVELTYPLQVIQDTISGLYIAEPVMEGKVGIGVDLTLSRYSTTTWQTITDAWTSVVARLSATEGYYLQEILVNDSIVTTSGPDEDNVSKEPLKLVPGDSDTNRWADYMYHSVLRHSPVMLRVRNFTSTNIMS